MELAGFWKASTEHMCSEAGDKSVLADGTVEAARSAVDHLVLPKTMKTISSRDYPKKQRLARAERNQQKAKRRLLKNLCIL